MPPAEKALPKRKPMPGLCCSPHPWRQDAGQHATCHGEAGRHRGPSAEKVSAPQGQQQGQRPLEPPRPLRRESTWSGRQAGHGCSRPGPARQGCGAPAGRGVQAPAVPHAPELGRVPAADPCPASPCVASNRARPCRGRREGRRCRTWSLTASVPASSSFSRISERSCLCHRDATVPDSKMPRD